MAYHNKLWKKSFFSPAKICFTWKMLSHKLDEEWYGNKAKTRHLITKEEDWKLPHTIFLWPLFRRHSVKGLTQRYQLFFFGECNRQKTATLFFFPFHTFPLVDVDVSKRIQSWRKRLLVFVMIAFFRYMNWSNKKNFSVMFHLHSCSSYFLFLSTKKHTKFKNYTFHHELEGSSENFC